MKYSGLSDDPKSIKLASGNPDDFRIIQQFTSESSARAWERRMLNQGYDKDTRKDLTMMGESIKKVEHADFVALLAKNEFDNTLIHGKVGKNRSGETNVSIDFQVDFGRFKFLNDALSANKDKQDDSTTPTALMKFQGFEVF